MTVLSRFPAISPRVRDISPRVRDHSERGDKTGTGEHGERGDLGGLHLARGRPEEHRHHAVRARGRLQLPARAR